MKVMKNLPNDQLKYIFSNVNYWLNFAELKHAALITFNSALLYKGIEMSKANSNKEMLLALILYLLFPIIALIISILSYSPNINSYKQKQELSNNEIKKINGLFYGDIVKLTNEQYARKIYSDCGCEEEINKLDIQYAEEIIVNSQITLEKYKKFKLALRMTLIGIILFAVGVIIAKFGIVKSFSQIECVIKIL